MKERWTARKKWETLLGQIEVKGKYPFFRFDAHRKLDFFVAQKPILKLLSHW